MIQSLLNASFLSVHPLDSHLTAHHSNIGVYALAELSPLTLLNYSYFWEGKC